MKRKFISILLVLVLVLSFSLVTGVPVAGVHTTPGTIYVDAAFSGAEDGGIATPFNTIGEAITHASAGDTISVVAGTYTENVVVDKALTLQGASGATIAPTTLIAVEIRASTVTVDGFTITPLDTTPNVAQG
ncbi:MAG: hypothetical protein V3V23_02915, partial [Dehalococcoidales bacterium]